jgi:hypothetical protein
MLQECDTERKIRNTRSKIKSGDFANNNYAEGRGATGSWEGYFITLQ